jgi:predicted nucleic acid-binding protein
MPESYTFSNTSPLLYLHLIQQTVGVIVKAKQSGLLPTVAPILSALREAGLWLSDRLVTDVLQQAGEA